MAKDYRTHLIGQYNTNTFKRKEEYIEYNLGPIIKRTPARNSKILEIGPGIGECVNFLQKNGFRNIDILDNDKNILSDIKNKYNVKITGYNNLGKYDLILMIQVLEHMSLGHQVKIFRLLYSHLNKNGIIVAVVPNANNPLGLVERYGDIQHTSSFTTQSLLDLVESATSGNYSAKVFGYEIPPYSLINILRIFLQKVLHVLILSVLVINGGTFFKILTPNIVLAVKKNS